MKQIERIRLLDIQDLAESRILDYTEGNVEGFEGDFGTILPFTTIMSYGPKYFNYYDFIYDNSLDLELIWREVYKAAMKLEVEWLNSEVNNTKLPRAYHLNVNTFEVIE